MSRAAHGSPVKALDLSLNPGIASAPPAVVGELGGVGLSSLDLSDCGVPPEATAALASSMGEQGDSGALRSLKLRSNQVDGRTALQLLGCTQLHDLALFDNPLHGLGDGMAAELVTAMQEAHGLRSLDLGACRLPEPLVLELLSALAHGAAPSLETIELFGNPCAAGQMSGAISALNEARPTLDVAWKEAQRDAAELQHTMANPGAT